MQRTSNIITRTAHKMIIIINYSFLFPFLLSFHYHYWNDKIFNNVTAFECDRRCVGVLLLSVNDTNGQQWMSWLHFLVTNHIHSVAALWQAIANGKLQQPVVRVDWEKEVRSGVHKSRLLDFYKVFSFNGAGPQLDWSHRRRWQKVPPEVGAEATRTGRGRGPARAASECTTHWTIYSPSPPIHRLTDVLPPIIVQ